MHATGLTCWKCGKPLGDEPLPLSRSAECRACHAQLHVCRMCAFFDPGKARSCREPVAEEVRDKERANFCGYFQPTPRPARGAASAANARAAAEALFGEGTAPAAGGGRSAAEELFRKE